MFMQDQTRFAPDFAAQVATTIAAPQAPVFARSVLSGLIAGTALETRTGWRDIAMLAAGDRVYTYDGGVREIRRLDRIFFDLDEMPGAPDLLVQVPGGALNTCSDVLALPDQEILLQSLYLEEKTDNPIGLVRLGDLVGLAGIRPVRPQGVQQAIRPVFDEDEVVWANTGLLCHVSHGVGQGVGQGGFFPSVPREMARNALRYELTASQRPLRAAA
jgi:Hint domain